MSATEAAPETGSQSLPHHLQHPYDSTATSPLSELDDGEQLDRPHGLPTTEEPAVKVEHEESEDAGDQIPANTTQTTLRPDPSPSAKRRESEVASAIPDWIEQPNNKKRKRGASPPWTFPTAENTTLKTADGRRISARVNSSTPLPSENDTRGRSSSLSAPPARSRPESPPWKKFEAAGPTSMVVDGKRKSGRVNKELTHPPKRVSPRSKKQGDRIGASQAATGKASAHGSRKPSHGASHIKTPSQSQKRPVKESSRPTTASDSASKIAELRAQIEALKPSRSFPSPEQELKRTHKRKSSNEIAQLDAPSSPTTRKHPRAPLSPVMTSQHRPSPKIKLRFSTARHTVPPPHPHAAFPLPVRPPRPSIFQAIERHELREMQLPYLENDRGPPDLAWFQQRAERQAVEESAMRRRILAEAESGGILSKEKSSLYQDVDAQAEPPKQYGHNDHLVAHALYLRQLQSREKTQHKLLAKKVAHEALEMWKARRGPTEEDIREEQDRMFRLIYKQVVADVKVKWDMVAAHVQAHKLRIWEAEEELRRQQRLQEKLEWSENMVARQRGEADESGEDSGNESSDEDSEEENMSEESSEDSEHSDAEAEGEMGEDELAAYLAQRETEPPDKGVAVLEVDDETAAVQDTRDASMADVLDGEDEDDRTASIQDVSMTELLGDSGQPDEQDEEFAPDDEDPESMDEDNLDHPTDIEHAFRRSRRSTATPGPRNEMDEAEFSSDESTNMDSEDYDSDEDMSSTGEEDNDADEQGGESDEEAKVPKNSLLSLFKDEVKKYAGLPTPTTSAEGDHIDEQAGAGAAAEITGMDGQDGEPSDLTHEESHEDMGVDTEEGTKEPVPDPEVLSDDKPMNTVSAPERPAAESVIDDSTKNLVPSPALLRGTLRSYQHTGLDWLASLYRNGTNGILADEMGLGKTIQTIALLAHLAEEHEVWDAHLVIVPTSVILNWVTEFQKFLPGFRVLGYYGTAEERQAKRRGWVNDPHHDNKEKRGYNVVITSYNVAMQDINAIRNVQWHYLVLDEAHNIRNFNSQRWQVLIRLKTRARLLLTGTPLQNSLTELWSLLTFLTAGDDDPAHGDLEEFLSHWKEPVKEIFDRGVQTLSNEAQKVVDQLHVSLRPFLLRRLKSEVEKDLPKKTESVVVCKLSKRQRQLYQDYMGLAETRRSLMQGNAVSAGKVLLSLRRVCNHPDLFDPRPIQTSYAMEKSALELYAVREAFVRKLLGSMAEVPDSLSLLTKECRRKYSVRRSAQLSATSQLEKEAQDLDAQISKDKEPDLASIAGCLALQRLELRREKLEYLRSCIRISQENVDAVPVYGSDLRELLTVHSDRPYRVVIRERGRVVARSLRGWPTFGQRPLRFDSEHGHVGDWMLSKTSSLQTSIMTSYKYAERLQDTVVRFAFCTPVVTAPVLDHAIPERVQQTLRMMQAYPNNSDYAHEARVRTSIAFPDSRLLVYDAGKLQQLTVLLRQLQAKGSRSLIFTQMTGTLNILEQFLSLLNLPYLRLDGSTPVERRQLYSAEFNRPDSKYQCMILSSRAGGVGLNLVGASSVIFYDLDWNPQMDRQCMDRAHRIGQVRDVEVYKMVSEKTVEENILRRAEQKSLLDQTVIQQGHFTTEYHRPPQMQGEEEEGDNEDHVAAAIERFLGGGNEKATTQAIESVEDKEDVQAAQQARKEEHQDDADFADRSSKGPSVPPTPGQVLAEDDGDEERKGHLDFYLIRQMERLLKDVPFIPPQMKKADRHGRDPGHRAKRKR